MLNQRRVRLRPSQGQVKQVLLKTAAVLLQDERYKIPIDDDMPPPSTIQPTQPRRT
ncbi:hypothetical protein OPW36_13945 [Vibrio europaeus]|uniref:hypothetical protein n=1 Tax=Vibrio europaeus TaxID=300876 RepID=UPI00233ECB8E|nr:hypothetical protein [Vibrio europaeus]MDC5808113.1 hypothetical protein [Vibrio europaeus]MDC5825812.1 hypothetical protein [Vibrio europaeus]MDC5832801.1 hypothetical protein [Vibrio europaeus]MDC5837679.1 hypothetical protein [Vibrio europaeus]